MTVAQAGAQTRMTHLFPMLCLDLRAPYSAELVQRPQQSRCEEVAAGPAVGPAPVRAAVCISGFSMDQKSHLAGSLLERFNLPHSLRNELEWGIIGLN